MTLTSFLSLTLLSMLSADAADREVSGAIQRLLSHENARIRESLRSGPTASRTPPAVPRDLGVPLEARMGAPGRRIEVVSAEALATALAAARPGDVIRIADGVYRGDFVAVVSGTTDAPITLWGSRAAILDGGSIATGYGFHLRADHWILAGFSVRNARKGIMTDGASHNTLRGLEIREIGEEGVHFRTFSSDNLLEGSWIHDVGRLTPNYGEGVYVGSARSNWSGLTGGEPDASNRNRILGNLVGPNVTAECVDAKEGTTGGEIRGNVFLGVGMRGARSWVDLKGNGYTAQDNTGTYEPDRGFEQPVRVLEILPGWGRENVVGEHRARKEAASGAQQPFRASYGRGPATLVLPHRALPYSLSELRVRFPHSIEQVEPGVALVKEHILLGPGATMNLTGRDARELRLLSHARAFVSLVAVRATLAISGSGAARVWIRSWDPYANEPDRALADGRAYVTAIGGRMDLGHVDATDLGFGTGRTSGVAWKGRPGEKIRGAAAHSRFERNHFGAYTFEAEEMQWVGNVFANNVGYGFDPHDHSDRFLVEGNTAFGNGRHGIIFSRGCRGNVLRKNVSHSNLGHGIMIDDGKVESDGDPRHARAVPSNDNLLEENEVWGNEVGIAFEGGTRNVVRNNRIHDNEYGIRLEGDASGNQIVANDILRSKVFAIHVYNHSDRNRILDNRIDRGQGGIVVKQSVENVIERNTLVRISGRGIVLTGRVTGSVVRGNWIDGRGSTAIDMGFARGLQLDRLAGNRTERWMPSPGFQPAIVIWGAILLVPLLVGLPLRWVLGWSRSRGMRHEKPPRRRRRLAIGFALAALATIVPAPSWAARRQSLELTTGLASYFDDNILRYSSEQILDLDSRLHPYRFGVARVDDWVFHPTLALLWREDRGSGGRRSVRLNAEGDVHRTNGVANVGAVGVRWREGFTGGRRLSLSYARTPDSYVRRLYDADLASLPTSERYRDASQDLHTAAISWRQSVPRASWLDLGYRYDRRRYSPEFRERDSDTHQGEIGVGWERFPRAGRFQLGVGYSKRDARAEDGTGPPGGSSDEADLGYHGMGMSVGGGLALGRVWGLSAAGDARYELELRRFDSGRPDDRSHYGRRDRFYAVEVGLSTRVGPSWSARGFYRVERNRADYGSTAAPGSEIGGCHVNQAGLALEWTGELWRRTSGPPDDRSLR